MIPFFRKLTVLILPLMIAAAAARADDEWAGTVKAVTGTVTVERDGKALPLGVGDKILPQDKLITGKDSHVAVTLRDDTLISTGADSQVALREFAFDAGTHDGNLFVAVLRGVTAMVSGLVAKANPQAMRVATPTATIGIRGTEFIV